MPSFFRSLVATLPLVGFALSVAVPAPQVTPAPACVHDLCSQKISQIPHKPMCPAYLAAGPGKAPAPPTYTLFEGCNMNQIYSVCSCFFEPSATSTEPSTSATTLPTSYSLTGTATTTATPSVTPSTTTTSTATSSTLNPQSPSPCPYADHSNVTTSGGKTYEILCGWNVLYQDDPSTYAETMEGCLEACDAYVPNPPGQSYDKPCISVTFTGLFPTGANCYLHYSTDYQQPATSPYYDSAILVSS